MFVGSPIPKTAFVDFASNRDFFLAKPRLMSDESAAQLIKKSPSFLAGFDLVNETQSYEEESPPPPQPTKKAAAPKGIPLQPPRPEWLDQHGTKPG